MCRSNQQMGKKKYLCPFCKNYIKQFCSTGLDSQVFYDQKVVGAGNRLALCPYCHSNDRERLLYIYLKNHTKIFDQNIKLLHLAPEKNLTVLFSNNKNIIYVTADLNLKSVMINLDINRLPFKSNFFDVIICNHVLEHIIDDKKAIAELYRVLHPNGWSILQVPISYKLNKTYEDISIKREKDRKIAFGQKDHVRIYGADYVTRLKNVGFSVDEFTWTTNNEHVYFKYGLNTDERIYIAKK